MARQPTHHLYLDDSGTKEYSATYSTRNGGSTPYFVFGGLLTDTASSARLNHEFNRLKLRYFGTADVEIKANWLRRKDRREAKFLRPYKTSEAALREFVEKVYDLIVQSPVELYSCAVNKEETVRRYGDRAWYAPAIAYDCLLQRVALDMQKRRTFVHVFIDDMSGATPKMRQYRDNLTRHHARLKTHGSALQSGIVFDGIAGLTFRNSASDGRLQLADLVAYAVYRQFVEFGAQWEQQSSQLPTYEFFKRLAPKFKGDSNGRIQGYGIVKFPLMNRIPWSVIREE